MPNVWNIGNTTVRNPKRIENALRVFASEGFSGNAKGSEQEAKLHEVFKEKSVLDFDGAASDFNGRKWRAAFYQLGFISYERYNINGDLLDVQKLFQNIGDYNVKLPFQLTKAGFNLINSETIPEVDDVYTRQFACYELPNSLESGFPDGKMKPFILFLQVLNLLQNNGHAGLNKFETGVFLQRFQNHSATLSLEIVDLILEYRVKCINKTPKELRDIKQGYLNNLAEITGINPQTIVRDYSDTTFRYFSLSGLFSRLGDTIIIRSNKRNFVNELLANEPQFLFQEDPIKYFKLFYSNTFPLPTDNLTFALAEVNELKQGIKNRLNPLLKEANLLSIGSNIEEVQIIRYKLIQYNNWEREEDFANEQQTNNSIIDILGYLNTLNNSPVQGAPDIDDKPAYLEWAVWRSFLAINEIICPVHETRRFPVDQDFLPRNTAPGGGSDLIFEFETYVLVVEVTLTVSHRQMSAESEPVRRHAVQYKLQYPEKDVYCLFIAPSVDNNVVETFRIGVWYNGDEEEFVNIIPMSLTDFIILFETLAIKRFRNIDFKTLLDRSLIFRNVRAPQWKASISKEVSEWRKRIIS